MLSSTKAGMTASAAWLLPVESGDDLIADGPLLGELFGAVFEKEEGDANANGIPLLEPVERGRG